MKSSNRISLKSRKDLSILIPESDTCNNWECSLILINVNQLKVNVTVNKLISKNVVLLNFQNEYTKATYVKHIFSSAVMIYK